MAKRKRNMKRSILSWLVLAIIVYSVAALIVGTGDIAETIYLVEWRYVFLACLLAVSNYVLRFVRWRYYLSRLGVSLPARDSFLVFMSGLAMSVTPAKAGEIYKAYLAGRESGAPVSRLVPVVVTERLVDVLALCVLAGIGYSAVSLGGLGLVGIGIACVIGVLLVRNEWFMRIVESFAKKKGWLSKGVREFHSGLLKLFSARVLFVSLVISVVSWGCECLAMWVVMRGFGVDASVLLALFVFSVSTLAGALSMIPGGLGVAEGGMAGLLSLAGIEKSTAVGVMIVTRACTLWLGVVLGLASLAAYYRKRGGRE